MRIPIVLFEKPEALANLLVGQLKLIEGLCVDEDLPVALRVAVGHTPRFQGSHRDALIFCENTVSNAAGAEVAQSGVRFVPGLRRTAGVYVLNDMRAALQHKDHRALALQQSRPAVATLLTWALCGVNLEQRQCNSS